MRARPVVALRGQQMLDLRFSHPAMQLFSFVIASRSPHYCRPAYVVTRQVLAMHERMRLAGNGTELLGPQAMGADIFVIPRGKS